MPLPKESLFEFQRKGHSFKVTKTTPKKYLGFYRRSLLRAWSTREVEGQGSEGMDTLFRWMMSWVMTATTR